MYKVIAFINAKDQSPAGSRWPSGGQILFFM